MFCFRRLDFLGLHLIIQLRDEDHLHYDDDLLGLFDVVQDAGLSKNKDLIFAGRGDPSQRDLST